MRLDADIELGGKRFTVSEDMIQNFVDCVITREKPVDNLHSAIKSDIICHLSDICIRIGQPIIWDSEKETIADNPEAVKRISRPMRKPWKLG